MLAVQGQSIAVNIALLVLMKLIHQLATFNYSLFNGNLYVRTDNRTCRYAASIDNLQPDPTAHVIDSYSYLPSVIGGVASSACRDRSLVLIIGGWLLTIGCALVAGVQGLGLACDRVAYSICWSLYPMFMSLLVAPLLSAFTSFGENGLRSGRRTLSLALYYVSASSTIWLNLLVWPLVNIGRLRGSHELLALGATIFGLVFVVAARLLRTPDAGGPVQLIHAVQREPFVFPTVRRMLRYFLITATFTLYVIPLVDGHIEGYGLEAMFYMNANLTDSVSQSVIAAFNSWNILRTVNIFGMLSTAALLIGTAAAGGDWSFESRIFTGVSLSSLAALWSLVCNIWMRSAGPVIPLLAATAFSVPALTDGIAELLTMVASYEFIDAISPPEHKDLLLGIAMTVWNTSGVLRRGIYGELMVRILARYPGVHATNCAKHSLALVMCVSCLMYTRFISLPLSYTILQTPAEPPDDVSVTTEESGFGESSPSESRFDVNSERRPLLA